MTTPEISLFIKHRKPVKLRYAEENKDLIALLLTALHLNKEADDEDEVIYVDMGENGDRSMFFKRSDLISVDVQPSPSREIFDLVSQNIANVERARASRAIHDGWKQWIWTHLGQGVSKDTIYQALLNYGFDTPAISRELNHAFCAANADPALVAQLMTKGNSGVYLPNAKRLDTSRAEIYTVEDFFSEDECARILDLMTNDLEPSRVLAADQINEARTSRTCFFRDRADTHAYINGVEDRICRYMGIHRSHVEGAQGQYYDPGQEYKPHADFFSRGTKEYEDNCREGAPGQRTWTFLAYLKDDFVGGSTRFNELAIDVKPRRGMAVVWNNLYPNGEPNPYTLHQATPVEKGSKAILNVWFRARGDGSEMLTKPDPEFIKAYTKQGIEKTKIPEPVYERLMEYYQENKDNRARIAAEEPNDSLNRGDGEAASEVITLTDEVRSSLHEDLKPVLEQWSGQTLVPTAVYGIRRYFTGARLKPHYDWSETHVISAILCLDCDHGQRWPLQIDDNFCRRHQIIMNPGEMLLYESARLLHGRPEPLQDGEHCNLYVHYRPISHTLPKRFDTQRSNG